MRLKKISQSLSVMLAGIFLLAVGLRAPALAQDDGDDTFLLEEIKVTAQFREQPVQSTPLSITALSGDEMLEQGLTDIGELSVLAPNVTITAGATAFGSSATAYIRGIGQYDTNFAYEPGVGMYVDDVYHGVLNGSFFDLLDLDRVEILRGPQGTLAGKNSIGGAVKLYSKKPTGDGSGYFQATYGSYNRIDLRGATDQSLIEDKLAVRVSGYTKQRDGYVDRLDYACDRPAEAGDLVSGRNGATGCKIGTLGGIKAWGLRANMLWTPSEDIEVNIIGSVVKDDSETVATEQQVANTPSYVYEGVPYDSRFLPNRPYVNYATFTATPDWNLPPLNTSHTKSISGTIDWKISDDIALKLISGYEDVDSAWSLDGDGSPLPKGLTLDEQPYHQFTQEIRLSGNSFDDMVEWTIGGFYFDSEGRVAAKLGGAADSPTALQFIQDDPVNNTSKAVYAQLDFHPTKRISVIGGIRYTDDKKTYEFHRLDNVDPSIPAPFPFSLIDGATGEYSGNSWDYRGALQYQFTDDIMAYGQFSTGYKGGGINPRPFTVEQVLPFDPERVDAFEAGVKTKLFKQRMWFNVSAFFNKYKDIILVDTNGYPGVAGDPGWFPFSAAPFNAGNADIKGVEVETTVSLANGLRVQGSVSYLDFAYKTLAPDAVGIESSFVPPFTPEWKWSLLASYDIELPSGGFITPQADASFMDDVFTDPANAPTNHLSSYTLANARISYRTPSEDWEMIFGVTNLTDKHYYTSAFDIAGISGESSFSVARPREWYVTMRRSF